jgi:PKD repeat protein
MPESRLRAAVIGVCVAIGLALAGALSVFGGHVHGLIADTSSATTPPTVSVIAAPASGSTTPGTPVVFIASATNGNPPYVSYLWTFGDGTSPTTTTSANTTHTYSSSGSFNVTVVVTDSTGMAGLGQATYVVNPSGTTGQYSVSIQATPTNPAPNTSVTFQAFTSGNVPSDAVYTWNFGDNSGTTTGQTVSHIYSTAGVYTVTLNVTSTTMAATNQTATLQLTVGTPAPAYTLSISGPTTATAGTSVTYTATVATGTAPSGITYSWTFGDGGTATGQTVSHTFANPGTYTVTLTGAVGSSTTGTQTASITVTVSASTPTGPTVTYQPGWNMVAGPAGTSFSQAQNPLYTIQLGTNQYQTQPNTQPVAAGAGYWAFFPAVTTVTLTGTSSTTSSVFVAAGTYAFVGNSSTTQTLTVRGPDACFLYNPTSNSYSIVSTLSPGQACAAFSTDGANVTVGP